MPVHSTLTGSELHENKGAAAAADNTVASATTGETVWRKVNVAMIDPAEIFTTNILVFNAVIDDVSTAGLVYIPIPVDCTIDKIVTVLHSSITVADATVTAKDAAGSSMGTITLAYTGSTAGDIDTLLPASNNIITADSRMLIETDGASTSTSKLFITVYATVTG